MSNPQDDQFCFFKQQEENETNKNYRLKQIIPIEKFLTRRETKKKSQEASKFSSHIRVSGDGFRTQPQFSGFSL